MKLIPSIALSAALFAVASDAFAQANYDTAKAELQMRCDAERKAVAGDPDKKVWDFVIADKKARTVTLLACGTSIKPTDPAEFFVAPVVSGKDYESLAVTFATPGDVRAALAFIGVEPGQPIDPEKNRYWPRGPRMVMTFTIAGKAVRAESLIVDTNTNQPMKASGLVYTGSYTYTDEQGVVHVAADESDARPIAPTYNDPAALFDVPAQAAQSTVYGFRKPSSAFTLKPGESTDIVISETTGAENVLVWDAFVRAAMVEGKARFSVQSQSPMRNTFTPLEPTAVDDLPHFVAKLATLADGKRDLFTTVHVADDVSVADVRNLYSVLQAVEKDRGVKLEPSAATELFHRALFPQPQWRDRATRLGEPWELFLFRDAVGKLSAKLERSVDNPDRNAVDPKIVESSAPADPAEMTQEANAKASRWSKAIFVYPPADLTYGELMTWVRPVLPTYPRVFVFPAEAPTAQPAAAPSHTRAAEPAH